MPKTFSVPNHPELDDHLSMLFGRLKTLLYEKTYCCESDLFLADLSSCSARTLQRRLKKLKDIGVITIETQKDGMEWDRRIYLNLELTSEK